MIFDILKGPDGRKRKRARGEPTHKNVLGRSGDIVFYFGGSQWEGDISMGPDGYVFDGVDVTDIARKQGWFDLDTIVR